MGQLISDQPESIQARKRRLREQATSKQSEFLRDVLVASTSMLGILIALHTTSESPLYIRQVFAAGILALVFGILMTVIALRYIVNTYRSMYRKVLQAEALYLKTGMRIDTIAAGNDTTWKWLQSIAYLCLLLGLLLLAAYAILSTLYT